VDLLDLARAELAANPLPAPPEWRIGDRVRVLRHQLPATPPQHVGDVGVVVCVSPLHGQPGGAPIVHLHARKTIVLVDFGPDADRAGGRDTWGYADTELASADAPPKTPRRKGKAR
jgi:hypothetical protein